LINLKAAGFGLGAFSAGEVTVDSEPVLKRFPLTDFLGKLIRQKTQPTFAFCIAAMFLCALIQTIFGLEHTKTTCATEQRKKEAITKQAIITMLDALRR